MASRSGIFKSHFDPVNSDQAEEESATQSLISALKLQKHPEGGYFAETDRDALRVPNPFAPSSQDDASRAASTTIFYLLTPNSSFGAFHRNKARTVHTLHKGRARYVLVNEDGKVETFVVGQDVANGEKLQWIVEGGKFKASFLLPDVHGGTSSAEGCLISETVVPGFEFKDHDFLTHDAFSKLVPTDQQQELEWLVRKE